METVNKETSANKNESNVPHGFFHGYDLGATGNVITALLIAISVFLVCMVITVLFFWLNEEYDLCGADDSTEGCPYYCDAS